MRRAQPQDMDTRTRPEQTDIPHTHSAVPGGARKTTVAVCRQDAEACYACAVEAQRLANGCLACPRGAHSVSVCQALRLTAVVPMMRVWLRRRVALPRALRGLWPGLATVVDVQQEDCAVVAAACDAPVEEHRHGHYLPAGAAAQRPRAEGSAVHAQAHTRVSSRRRVSCTLVGTGTAAVLTQGAIPSARHARPAERRTWASARQKAPTHCGRGRHGGAAASKPAAQPAGAVPSCQQRVHVSAPR